MRLKQGRNLWTNFLVIYCSVSAEGKALGVMNLSYPFTRKELKLRYIGLAKKYHPDMNGGSREAEERLKKINRAYEMLKKLVEC